MSPLLPLISIAQLSLTTYTLYLSSITIPKLLSYEDKAKTASKYSNIAEEQLFKTRATQAASVGSLILTLLSTSTILFTSTSTSTVLVLVGINVVTLLGVREYVGNFWKSKPKMPLPGTGDYNDAVGLTMKTREMQAWLAAGWGLIGVCAGI
ncbi:hypothetical protein ACMFMF_000985 [Clarireedia jacksonii]